VNREAGGLAGKRDGDGDGRVERKDSGESKSERAAAITKAIL
jgi:hypothetical protein